MKALTHSALRAARKAFPKQPQPWHLFTTEDYKALPQPTEVHLARAKAYIESQGGQK